MGIRERCNFLVLPLLAMLMVSCASGGDAGYDPKADANAQLDAAFEMARQRGKNVLVQVGGGWCPWCVRLHSLFERDVELHERVYEDYVWVQIYYGRDNENASALSRLGDLKGYGYPVLVVVSPSGRVVHVQNTGDLEEGKGYNRAKVLAFLDRFKDGLTGGAEADRGSERDTVAVSLPGAGASKEK